MIDATHGAVGLDDPDNVYVQIRRAVIEGRYPPGTRLVEQRLAQAHDVSRTPVREALRRLEAEGLVVVARNRGAQVRRLDADEIADLYDARSRLESYAAELAAERRLDADLGALDAGVEAFDVAVHATKAPTGDLEKVRALDAANARFHRALLDASHHTRLHQLVGRTIDVPLVFQALRHFDPHELERSNLFHHLIRDAVADREPVRAGRLMIEHVLQGRDGLLARLEHAEVTDLFAIEDA